MVPTRRGVLPAVVEPAVGERWLRQHFQAEDECLGPASRGRSHRVEARSVRFAPQRRDGSEQVTKEGLLCDKSRTANGLELFLESRRFLSSADPPPFLTRLSYPHALRRATTTVG